MFSGRESLAGGGRRARTRGYTCPGKAMSRPAQRRQNKAPEGRANRRTQPTAKSRVPVLRPGFAMVRKRCWPCGFPALSDSNEDRFAGAICQPAGQFSRLSVSRHKRGPKRFRRIEEANRLASRQKESATWGTSRRARSAGVILPSPKTAAPALAPSGKNIQFFYLSV